MNNEIGKNSFQTIDLRNLSGLARIEKKTGNNLKDILLKKSSNDKIEGFDEIKETLETVKNLENCQIEGRSFKAQQKWVKNATGAIATAWMEKKYPDEEHVALSKNSDMNKYFSHIEIDNDVSPEEFKKFEKDIMETIPKLPSYSKDKTPKFKIRKLGKHKADGVYFPHVNTVCVDVHDSSSFIHEYFHGIDITENGGNSMTEDFKPISKLYNQHFTPPPDLSNSKVEYYLTPTEIHSRIAEVWAHERLGINNKLVNPERFDSFDYKPFENPELKEKAFEFFDKYYKK